jgi:hypothetical protein
MRTYTIRAGCSFLRRHIDGHDEVLMGGQQIELDDDVALSHAGKIEPVVVHDAADAAAAGDTDAAVQTSAPEGGA